MKSYKQRKLAKKALTFGISLMLSAGASTAEMNTGLNPYSIRLAQVSSSSNQSAQSWVRKGDQLRAIGKYEEAIAAYRKAEAAGAGSDQLTFKIADTYKDMKRDRDAYWEFSKVSNSKNDENRMTACEQMELLKHMRSKSLKDPYFADLYTHGGYQSIGDTAFIDMKGRWGITKGTEKPLELYLFAHYIKDNRSGVVGSFAQEYFDNVFRAGAGLQKKLLTDHGLYFIAEAGRARDLIDLGRDRNRDDYRAGFEYYQEWGTDYNCRSTNTRPNRFILTASGELKYYSRYDDAVLFSVDVRPGLRLLETRKSNVDAFMIFSYNTNLKESANTYTEVGAGVSWVPNRQYDFKITAKVVETYFKGGDSDTNAVLEFEHYILW